MYCVTPPKQRARGPCTCACFEKKSHLMCDIVTYFSCSLCVVAPQNHGNSLWHVQSTCSNALSTLRRLRVWGVGTTSVVSFELYSSVENVASYKRQKKAMTRRGPIPQKIDVMFMPNRSKWKLLAFWKRQVTDEKSSWPKAKHWAWIIIYVEGSNKKNAAPVNNKQPSAEWACWRQRSDTPACWPHLFHLHLDLTRWCAVKWLQLLAQHMVVMLRSSLYS